jgi:hypothetical protein
MNKYCMENNLYKCSFCGELHSKYGIKNHERHCHSNPNRVQGINNFHKDGKTWNKGLTKETDSRVAKGVSKWRQNYLEGKFKNWSQGLTKENDSRIARLSNKTSETIKEKVKNGEWHCSFSKSRSYQYKGVTLHGSWELNFVKYLDKKSIEWKRPNKSFQYFWNNEYHEYFPDLYLPEFDLYLEIKGYPTERDICKWEQFPKDEKLDIYFGDELLNAKIISECRDVYNNLEKFRKKNYNLLS